ncbi:MAG TPA: glucose 1-dehydrogenase [Rhizobiaceae bacterium]|nr:glucose 1-dehydrogenase [Rhizobiaceae bacterium]
MKSRLSNKVAVITGAASGIGRAIAERYSKEGCKVVIADIDEARGRRVAAISPESMVFQKADIRQEADVELAIKVAFERFGRLDIMVNNAGMPGRRAPISQLETATFDDEMNVLFRSVFLGMKHAAPILAAQKSGAIISIGSVAGLRTGWGSHIYSAAKAAIVHLTRTVAMELGERNVRVNCICPGGIATSLLGKGMGFDASTAETMVDDLKEHLKSWQPIPRAGLPEDIAAAAVFLASDEASFINGHALIVDGGLTGGRGWSETLAARNKRISDFHAMEK